MSAAQPPAGPDLLEGRRRLALRGMVVALAVPVLGWPLGMLIGESAPGSETHEAIGGALVLAGVVGLGTLLAIPRVWQNFMRRRMLHAVTADLPDVRHIDGEEQVAVRAALGSPAFQLGAFQQSGLVEPFATACVDHVLAGVSRGVPFALAELRLLDEKGGRVFAGVLASFRLARPRPGLTIVSRDQGLLGNLLARAGSGIDRVALEDPAFEGVFEVHGTDQVEARVILTATMLERLKALDELAHARGFACAFRGSHLLVAFSGMHWRCPAWRLFQPIDVWLGGYRVWLRGLVGLPVEVVATLDLRVPSRVAGEEPAAVADAAMRLAADEVFSTGPFRLLRVAGLPAITIASGLLFGGLAAFFGWYGLSEGFPDGFRGYAWSMVALGLGYGAYAIVSGLLELSRAAWTWGAPLRGLVRPPRP